MMKASLRPAAVANLFYPGQTQALRDAVQALMSAAAPAAAAAAPKVLIAPHAGYVYSGPTAAAAYRQIAGARDRIRRVVLLGPAHRVAVRGIALPAADAFATPLGDVQVDATAVQALADLAQVCISDAAHAQEHCLEVHLPFLQQALGDFAIVPLVVGEASCDEIAQVLERLWGGEETLIIVSSDLSHYLPYLRARARDEFTAESILRLRGGLDHEQACGATPINGLLQVARSRGLRPQLLDLCNSGDTAGDKSRVVGYAAFAFYEPESPH